MCLIDFATLPLDELTAEIERMLHERRVKHYPSTLSTPAAPGEITNPPACTDPGVAGTNQRNTNQTTRI